MFRTITKEEADKIPSFSWFVWVNGKIEWRTHA